MRALLGESLADEENAELLLDLESTPARQGKESHKAISFGCVGRRPEPEWANVCVASQ
jgi:hypothetical protein